MLKRASIMLLTVLLSMAWLTAIGFSGQPRSKPKKRSRAAAARAAAAADMERPVTPKLLVPGHNPDATPQPAHHFQNPQEEMRSLPTNFVVNPQLKGRARTLHEQAVGQLARATVPEQRVQHFNWLADWQKYRVTGWHGSVQGMEPTPDGYVVSVLVLPSFTAHGASAATMDSLIEQYVISHGQVHFNGAIGEPGTHQGVDVTD